MSVPPAVARRYGEDLPYLKTLRQVVSDTIIPFCRRSGFTYDSRIKTLESVAEKIESGRYDGWLSLDDLVAAVVVVPTYRYEEDVLSFLDSVFLQFSVKRRGASMKPPDVFRFDCTRFIGRLRPREGEPRTATVDATLFEIQIRSAFEHAWSVTTHDLVYKADMVDWGRRRLAAQLKAAVEQIDMLIAGFETSAESIDASHWPEVARAAEVQTLLQKKFDDGSLPQEFKPKDWTRLADNVTALLDSASTSRRDREIRFSKALEELDSHLTPERATALPLTCSLFQVTAGILVAAGILGGAELDRFHFPATAELIQFFPDAERLGPTFTF